MLESNHEQWMSRALTLAYKGAGHVSPNPMVGAVIIKDGGVIAEGYHTRFGAAHAEVEALDKAYEAGFKGHLDNAVMYVTLEPCCHYGKQPPCTDAILKSGIGTVVIAMQDPNPQVAGKGTAILKEAGVICIEGVLEDRAKTLNRAFIKSMTRRKPFVLLKSAISLDGAMATHKGDSKWISSPESREEAHLLRHEMDAIMVGIGTVLADNPSLDVRLGAERIARIHGAVVNPWRIIVDPRAELPLDSKLLEHVAGKTVVAVTSETYESQDKHITLEALRAKDATIIPCRSLPITGRVDLNHLMERLHEMGIMSILLEGGATLAGAALQLGIVDRVRLYQAQIFLGDSPYRPTVGFKSDTVPEGIRLLNATIRQSGGDTVIEGDVAIAGDMAIASDMTAADDVVAKGDMQTCLQES